MATKLVRIERDERFPDFSVWPIEQEWLLGSFTVEVTITEEEYKEFQDIEQKYNQMQEYLSTLYNKARNYAKAEKLNS